MLGKEFIKLDISEEEIRETFRLLTARPISQRSISVGKSIAKTAQKRVIGALKSGLVLSRDTNQYLIEAEVVNELLKRFDTGAIETSNYE